MQYVNKKNVDISFFTMGTVQLGMDYGLGDFTAKPKKEYAFELLNCAIANGVNCLDTANNYGESERVIGEWLATVAPEKRPMVVTKIGPFDHSSPEALRADMQRQTDACLKTLGVETLDVLMLHYFEDYEQDPETVRAFLADMKAAGRIRYSGISVYSRHDYKFIAEAGFDSIQIPLNLFDWGQIENGGIQALADSGMIVFARSVFLQGLVFLKPEDLGKQKMEFARPTLEKFLSLCEEFNMSPSVLAVSFIRSVPGITAVALGCQTIEQIEGNCDMIDQVRILTPAEMSKIREAFLNIDPMIINPGLWPNHT